MCKGCVSQCSSSRGLNQPCKNSNNSYLNPYATSASTFGSGATTSHSHHNQTSSAGNQAAYAAYSAGYNCAGFTAGSTQGFTSSQQGLDYTGYSNPYSSHQAAAAASQYASYYAQNYSSQYVSGGSSSSSGSATYQLPTSSIPHTPTLTVPVQGRLKGRANQVAAMGASSRGRQIELDLIKCSLDVI
uniref:Uncharacterized protein n=1 Tax=Timema poppense TaxID=170557 RepID=A0A7R9H786_TIMPO|nr:unnamed protein product [Timema poppensis]